MNIIYIHSAHVSHSPAHMHTFPTHACISRHSCTHPMFLRASHVTHSSTHISHLYMLSLTRLHFPHAAHSNACPYDMHLDEPLRNVFPQLCLYAFPCASSFHVNFQPFNSLQKRSSYSHPRFEFRQVVFLYNRLSATLVMFK